MKKIILILIILSLLSFFLPVESIAQCPMCRASAETSIDEGNTTAIGINKGILYLFCTPYLIAGAFAFMWWRAHRKPKLIQE